MFWNVDLFMSLVQLQFCFCKKSSHHFRCCRALGHYPGFLECWPQLLPLQRETVPWIYNGVFGHKEWEFISSKARCHLIFFCSQRLLSKMATVLDRPSEAAGWLEAAEALLVRLRAIFFVENDRLGLVRVSQVWLMTPPVDGRTLWCRHSRWKSFLTDC